MGYDPSGDPTTLSLGSPNTICISDIYIMVHSSSKLTVIKVATKIVLCLGMGDGHHNIRNGIKGSSIRKMRTIATLCTTEVPDTLGFDNT